MPRYFAHISSGESVKYAQVPARSGFRRNHRSWCVGSNGSELGIRNHAADRLSEGTGEDPWESRHLTS
jgi:hypothetical protein